MTRPARSTTTSKKTVAEAPVSPAPASNGEGALDVAALVANAREITELPKVPGGFGARPGSVIASVAPLVAQAFTEQKAFSLPPVAEAGVGRLVSGLRNAAKAQGVAVKIRQVPQAGGMVEISFTAVPKK